MLHKRERYVFFYDFVLQLMPDKARKLHPGIPLIDALPSLKKRFDDGECIKLIQNETAAVRLMDMKDVHGGDAVAFLVAYADKNSADPAFMDLVTGVTNIVRKSDDQGGAYTAHCVLKTKPTDTKPYRYTGMIEKVPGATRSVILPFMNTQLREACKFDLQRKNKRPIKCWPAFEALGQQSEKLGDALSTGQLKEVELVRYEYEDKGIDQIGGVVDRKMALSLKPSNKLSHDGVVDWLEKLKSWGKQKSFKEMKVRYRSDIGKDDTVTVPTAKTDVSEFLFNKHEMIKVDDDIDQLVEVVRDDVVDKMMALMEQT